MLVFKPELLKAARKNSGLTVKEVAAAIGYCPMMLYHWENRRSRIYAETLAWLVDLYGISISDLFIEEAKKEGDLSA
jgi:transcriptional regulator with XRE-family HTH domain